MTEPSSRRLFGVGLVLVLATATISGISTFVNTYAVAGTNSDAFVTVRNLAVAAMLVPFAVVAARVRGRTPTIARADWGRLVAIGLVGGAIPFLLFFRGLELATAAHGATTASFFYRTLFLVATVLAFVVLKERFRWGIVVGAGFLLAGSYLLLAVSSAVWTDGAAYVLAATILWAVEYTISKRTLRDLPASTVALARMGFGGLFLAGYLGATAQWGAVAALSGAQWTWVGISAGLLVAFVATWYAGLARVDLSIGAAVLVLGYPVTWLLAVGLRGVPVATDAAAGAFAVLVGVVAVVGLAHGRSFVAWIRDGLSIGGRPAP